jgi:hypothetical protein
MRSCRCWSSNKALSNWRSLRDSSDPRAPTEVKPDSILRISFYGSIPFVKVEEGTGVEGWGETII